MSQPEPRLDDHSYSQPPKTEVGSTRKALLILFAIFALSVISLAVVYMSFPQFEPDEAQHIKLPRNIEDAKHLGTILSKYKQKHYVQVLSGVFITYIFLQTFAIPGSIFLSILSGYLFPFPVALLLVCFCSAVGASFCYFLWYLVGRRIVFKYFPTQARDWAETVDRQKENLLNYIIFLRITPFLPNWFINITSPIINVPISAFFLGTFLGVAPPSCVAIQAGTTLHQLTSSSDTVSFTSIALLGGFALLSIVPVIYKQQLKQKFE